MKVEFWHSADIKPQDNQKIRFKTYVSAQIYEGLFIEKEDMFFVGFGDKSDDFFFSFQIEKWQQLDESKTEHLDYFRKQAENNYWDTPLDVLKYIKELESIIGTKKTEATK